MARPLYIICASGTREKLQLAAMVASVAAAGGDKVSVFFSMNALAHFVKGRSEEAPAEGPFGDMMARKGGVPPFKQLFQQAAELGDATLLPCSMAMDLLEIGPDELEPALGPPTGLTRFLSDAQDGQLVTF